MALTTAGREPGQTRDASPGFRTILLVIVSITLMVLDRGNDQLNSIRSGLSVMLRPIEILVSAPFDFSYGLSESMQSSSNLMQENERLKSEALVRNARLQTMAALRAENARLRALLDSTEKVGESILIAEIVSVDMNPFRNMILLNKGSQEGAYVGQPLIDADGIVGQITRDRHFNSEAMLVTDIDHALPIEIARNRLRTIAVGTGELDRLSLPFLPNNADVEEGDLLISSGLGGKFPPGYPVGTIRKIKRVTGQPFLEIQAEPAAALNRIREVLLLTPKGQEEYAEAPTSREEPAMDLAADSPGIETSPEEQP
jgi:rod shape-determining protein MreC